MNDMKTEMLRVRMTPEEKAALHKQASLHRKSMSEYIRSVAKCPPDVTRDEFDASIVRMIYEIKKNEEIATECLKHQRSRWRSNDPSLEKILLQKASKPTGKKR